MTLSPQQPTTSPALGTDLGAAVRSSVGGELRPFTNLMYTSRNEAVERLVGECMGAQRECNRGDEVRCLGY
ncbi:uncharacterized protein P174DRAFT_439435 [Aspergillus novofumigatus IBT 16806]|uniref:Uncharacterized protein n=1 Tax=Aspergillus novofumigatus (strain IBT 16806) TaxID=1392255 RepID=A0A2I1CJ61_ASPN1|nr:uncharacterized protein P174DRAFT_439435 [Aspergillus novofumigatus IBT 16806]PKX97668.1 hypothetical protein P174DRAFT_439435 [Aspergillus novofumigatus IBT 16806]